MNNPLRVRGIPGPLARLLAVLALLGGSAADAGASPGPGRAGGEGASAPATAAPAAATAQGATAAPATDEDRRWGAALSVETSIGLGTFVGEPEGQASVATSFSPSATYRLADKLTASASVALTWYQVLDFATPLKEHSFLLSDISLGLSHGSIYKHEGSGFNLSGGLSVSLPTSLASQFQNRLFTLKPSFTASVPVGPVTFAYTFGFGKFFNLTASATVDCDDFADPAECREGREDNPDFGFESERRGAEVYLPGSGSSSFFVQNGLSVRWAILEGLDLALGVTVSSNFGVRTFADDALASAPATSGRAQSDRLVSSLSLSYQILEQLGVGASLVTATGRPFGDQGNDFVIFDFKRAPDNITSLNLSVTGSL